jgi:hypothetical protein
MSDKKILAIDPNMFSFSNNTTRKKRDKPETDAKIKMKAAAKPVNNSSLKKRSIINMMRKHQETQYKQKFDTTSKPTTSQTDVSAFKNDFDNAKEYFKNLQETVNKNAVPKNHTLKQLPTMHSPPIMQSANISAMQDVTNNVYTTLSSPTARINTQILPTPKYGCLKNGTLPTFRNLTQRTYGGLNDNMIVNNTIQQPSESYQPPSTYAPLSFVEKEKPIISNEIIQKFDKLHNGGMKTPEKVAKKIKYLKRKKIFKRTTNLNRPNVKFVWNNER